LNKEEYIKGINILIDAYTTDPTKWDELSEEYKERMERNYKRYFAKLDGERFIKSCLILAKNIEKFPTCAEMLRQYKETIIQTKEERIDESKCISMPKVTRIKVDKMKQELKEKKIKEEK